MEITTESKTVKSLSELKVGMKVKISDGSKRPPSHHVKKLRDFEYRNREVYVYEVDEDLGSFGVVESLNEMTSTGLRVRVVALFRLSKINVEILPE